MSSFRRMSVSRGSIVGLGDGGALTEPLANLSRRSSRSSTVAIDNSEKQQNLVSVDGSTGRRLSAWRVNIENSTHHTIYEEKEVEEEGGLEEKEEDEEKNPWSKSYLGIPLNYLSVGFVYGGSVNLLFPVLIIQYGVDSSFFSAATSLVTLFWSYKIFFGMLSDCLPIAGRRWKWYIVMGWMLCAGVLIGLASMGDNVSPIHLVVMLTLANLGYVMADVAADGFMVWMAHREKGDRRGKIQTLIYLMREVGRLAISIVVIFGFSGPTTACPGYESDPSIPCTTDETVANRNDAYKADPTADDWCYEICDKATFPFGLTIPQYIWIIAGINIISIPAYFCLHEDKRDAEKAVEVLKTFWTVLKKKAVWQLILYTMVSSITFNVYIAAKNNANFVWLGFTNVQQQLQSIFENIVFLAGLSIIRRYGLTWSWRKMVWSGTLLVAVFNLMYLLIVFDVIRNPWFYIFVDVTDNFMMVLNFIASTFAIVEVSEPGFEAITYALITTANNATIPLSVVISYQFMAFFPELNTQEGLATDTPEVRKDMAFLVIMVEAINVSSLLALPMLFRNKEEAKDTLKEGEESAFWAKFAIGSGLIFLLYSTVVTFMTVAGADTYGCLKILGGAGCTEDESSIPVYCLVGACFLYCYGVNFYHTFWPIITGKRKFTWDMFV